MFAAGPAAAQATERGLFAAMLEVEAVLAEAAAAAGLIPGTAAAEIVAVCGTATTDVPDPSASALSPEAVGIAGAPHAQPVVALVAALRDRVSPEAAPHVHHGATSQDIMDTALMLVARRTLDPLTALLEEAADRLAALAAEHAGTPVLARTLMQGARPTSFGLVLAGWLSGLDGSRRGLERIAAELPVQLGGPVGAWHAPGLVADFAARLGLGAPTLAWHGDRRMVGELAGALGVAAGTMAKFAADVILSAQTEVGELSEAGEGGRSSSMAHKHNPVAAITVSACTRRVPGLVGTLLAGMAGEQQRAAGAWQAEWPTLLELLALTGSAAAWSVELAGRLTVHPEVMAARLAPEDPASATALGQAAALVADALAARP